MFEVDWRSKAPEWAEWHVFDIDGAGWFLECMPLAGSAWFGGPRDARAERSIHSLPDEAITNWKETLTQRPSRATTQPKKHPHYHKPTNGAETVDVYWVLNAWGVECHAVGHAVKKLLNAGQRGAKSKAQDLQEAIDSIQRAIELGKTQ